MFGLLIVTTWFQIKLDWDTYLMRTVRKNILWWALIISLSVSSLWSRARAFLYDNAVVRSNHEEATLNGWSDSESPLGHPHLLAKLVRRTFLVSRGVVRGAIRATDRIVSHIKRDPHPNRVDVERGRRDKSVERANLQSTHAAGAPGSVDKALEEYIRSVRKTFTDHFLEDRIYEVIQKWKAGS